MNVICFKDNSKNVVLIAFQYIKNKNIFIVNEHRKLKMNPIDDMTLNKVNRIDDMEQSQVLYKSKQCLLHLFLHFVAISRCSQG